MMKIVIDDENGYFSLGLKSGIQHYADKHNRAVRFLAPGDKESPDVVIASPARYMRIREKRRYYGTTRVVITRNKTQRQILTGMTVLYHSDNFERLFLLLDDIFFQPLTGVGYQPLSRRENQVVGYLQQGFDQSQTARMMGVSVKTVHSHKRSIMSKMMLYRKHDFIYWLLSKDSFGVKC